MLCALLELLFFQFFQNGCYPPDAQGRFGNIARSCVQFTCLHSKSVPQRERGSDNIDDDVETDIVRNEERDAAMIYPLLDYSGESQAWTYGLI